MIAGQTNSDAAAAGRHPILEVTHVAKTFAGQTALADVGLTVQPGEVHALVGQNGSGKSTLIKILSGYHAADNGAEIRLLGERVDPVRDVATVQRHAHFIHQDLGLIGSLNTIDNLALGSGYELGALRRIKWRAAERAAEKALHELGMSIDVRLPVANLAAVERTMVAVARAMRGWDHGPGLFVLDEPTVSLPGPDVARLFKSIRRLTERGTGVLYVSHRLDEVFEIADRVSVLRDGRLVASAPVNAIDHAGLVAAIVGRPLASLYTPPPPPLRDLVLSARDLHAGRIRGLSFDLRRREILGITGLLGSGMEEIAEVLFGAIRTDHGSLMVEGREVSRLAPDARKRRGIGMVPANRAVKAVVPTHTVRENMLLPDLASVSRRYGLSRKRERRAVMEWIRRVDIRPPDPEVPISQLSGGNQQKVIISRWLRTTPTVLILHEPTQGVDVGAKAAIWELLANAAEAGMSIVICTADIDDLPQVCDRVLVVKSGRCSSELAGAALSADNIAAGLVE